MTAVDGGFSVLIMPFGYAQGGVILGLVLMMLAAILNYFTAFLLVLTGDKAKKYLYYDLA